MNEQICIDIDELVDVSLLQNNSEWNVFVIEILRQKTTVELRDLNGSIGVGFGDFESIAGIEVRAVL